MAKRLFDILLSLVALVLLWPVLLGAMVLIKLDDRGAIFYRQVRVGRFGREFKILKFRSMREKSDVEGPSITAAGDPRITRVGRWLRKTKLDELPQLWNVVLGQMSFVGPRPEVPKYVVMYTDEQKRVLDLVPGITDEASVKFKDEEVLLEVAPDAEKFYVEYCIPRKIALNLEYARNATILTDIGIIVRTINSVWFRR